jgi:hypothetical protein
MLMNAASPSTAPIRQRLPLHISGLITIQVVRHLWISARLLPNLHPSSLLWPTNEAPKYIVSGQCSILRASVCICISY